MARDGALMATAFDPTRFIMAEEARKSQTVASVASDFGRPATPCKHLQTHDNIAPEEPALAAIATIAAVGGKVLPWEPELRLFVNNAPPSFVAPDLWNELIEEAWDVHRQWGTAAMEAGWTVLDLFGCNPDPTAIRLDRNGLVASIVRLKTTVRITALDGRTATLQPRAGQAMRYYRSPAPGAVPLWSAYIDPDPP